MPRTRMTGAMLGLLLAAGLLWPAGVKAQPGRRAKRPDEAAFEARRLLKTAQSVLAAGERERGVRMLERLLEQYPRSPVRYEAYLELGKQYLKTGGDRAKAIAYLRELKDLKKPDAPLEGRNKELYLEGLYLTGVAHFQGRNYGGACAVLRRITREYPNTVWANQSYYYIGMCHFAQKRWNDAVRSLSLVGTFVDPDSPSADYAEAGRRFYVKVVDADLPVLRQLGAQVTVVAATARGDHEVLRCIPLAERKGIYIGSIPTAVGPPEPGDNVLQVVGGDAITVRYTDANTKDGRKDVKRQRTVRVVSTATVSFTVSTFESPVTAAYLGQPLYVLLHDVDLDASAGAEKVTVKVVSRYKAGELEGSEASAGAAGGETEVRYRVRDEVTLTLTELGRRPVHTGRFGGAVVLVPHQGDRPADRADKKLSCAVGDEVVAVYIDELHLKGTSPRQVEAKLAVLGQIDNAPRATQDLVPDPIIRTKKKLVEATAFLELARIFQSMGLKDGARAKAAEGLRRVEPIIRMAEPIPTHLRQEAFKLKWNLYIAQEDYAKAIATCRVFNRLYPTSPYVDEALMSVARIKLDCQDYDTAIGIFRQVLALPKSRAKAEAQFLIAKATEARGGDRALEAAIKQYRLCAQRYADSQYAGPALAKLVQYHIDKRDYARANDLLEQIFQDHPDADFLDQMLLKWIGVAAKMGDYQKAHKKCRQLIFSYPGSVCAKKAKKEYLPTIKRMLQKARPSSGSKG